MIRIVLLQREIGAILAINGQSTMEKHKKRNKPTAKQWRFIDNYLVSLNVEKAAIEAGYSEKNACRIGIQILNYPHVAAAVTEARARLSYKTTVKASDVIDELARVAFSNMASFAEFGPAGVLLKDISGLPIDAQRCISEISENRTKDGGSQRFKLHDKIKALELLGRHLGIYNDKLELKGSMSFADLATIAKSDVDKPTND